MAIKKLLRVEQITGKIKLLSGLHIGSGGDEIHIGGIDNSVIKDPFSKLPYIPGSSLKGKVRSLVELATGRIPKKGCAFSTDKADDPVARIFGNGTNLDNYNGGPTRASFSDCHLLNASELIKNDAVTEAKAEVSISRLTGTASGGGPRQTERVPRGAIFNFNISYKVFDCEDSGSEDEKNLELLKIGLKLLENDALGGSGSRGYGRVEFDLEGVSLDEINIEKDIEKFMV